MQYGERPLTPAEVAMLTKVYRKSVNLDLIRVVDGFVGLFSVNDRAFTVSNKIYMKNENPATYKQTLVHECCHVWQNQHRGTRYISDAAWAQMSMRDPYIWQDEISRGRILWQDFNFEAQAQFIQEVWRDGRKVPTTGDAGEFYDDMPVGSNVSFMTAELTGFAKESILFVRSLPPLGDF